MIMILFFFWWRTQADKPFSQEEKEKKNWESQSSAKSLAIKYQETSIA